MKPILYAILAAAVLAGCADRASELDRLMASEPSLARLQRQLDWTIAAAEGGEQLADEQSRWRKGLQDCLDSEDPALCAAEAHRERLEDLRERFGLDARRVAVDAAGRMGFDFRAVGNEPGWNLMISAERCVWETDYGQTRHDVATTESKSEGDARLYRARIGQEELVVRVDPGPCADDMSGEEFPWRVTLRFQGRTLRGCADRTGT